MGTSYPTVKTETGIGLAQEFLATSPRSLTSEEVAWAGSGAQIDLTSVEEASYEVSRRLSDFQTSEASEDRDLFEGQVAAIIHPVLEPFPTLALDDPGFWQYLSLAYFWEFVRWREGGAFDQDPGKYLKYLDGRSYSECVLRRTFLRGQAVGGAEGYQLASIEKSADFWRSHVIRVSVGSSVPLTQAFAREHKVNRLTFDELRPVARRLNRQVTNVVLPMVDDEQAEKMVHRARHGT